MRKSLIMALVMGLMGSFALNAADKVLTEEQLQKTAEAAPKALLKKPAKPRKILIYSRTAGYRHGEGIPAFNELMKAMEKNFKGAWKLTFSEDPKDFEPENLKKYDCIIMNNPTSRFFGPMDADYKKMTAEEKKAADEINNKYFQNLKDYVANGGGIMGMHAACDVHHEQTDYVEFMGGKFAGHPWNAGNKPVTVIVEDKTNVLTKGLFKDGEFKIQDEIYTFKDGYRRDNRRMLMSLDYDRSPVDPDKDGNPVDAMSRTSRRDLPVDQQKDFGLVWVKTYEKGRIFYGAFGHRLDIYWRNPEICEMYMRGIQYACGDLKGVETLPAKK